MKDTKPSNDFAAGLSPDLVRIKRALVYTNFSQTLLYELMMRGEISWFSVKLNPAQKRGIRFISLKSIDAYLARQAAAAQAAAQQSPAPLVKTTVRKAKPAKETAARGVFRAL